MVLIANLIFTVIHKRIKEVEQFTTLVFMARANLISYVYFQTILKNNGLAPEERNLELIQPVLFESEPGGFLEKMKNHLK